MQQSFLKQLKARTLSRDVKSYNISFKPTLGSDEIRTEWDATWYNAPIDRVYELCRAFEMEHENDSDEKDVYTGDDAFPDSYNHQAFMRSRSVDEREMEWERTKMNHQSTLRLWEKIEKNRSKILGVPQ